MPSRLLVCLLACVLSAVALQPARSAASSVTGDAVCYAVADDATGQTGDASGRADALFRITPSSGAEALVGASDTEDVEAIAYLRSTGTLYGVDRGYLGTFDLGDGAFTRRAQPLGSGDGAAGRLDFDDVDGLAFDQTTGVLFGSIRREQEDLLIQIDVNTGRAVANAFGTGRDYVVVGSINGLRNVDDLAVGSDGALYGVLNLHSASDRLVRIDRHTGATTDLGRIRLADGTDLNNIEALTTDVDGTLVGIRGGVDSRVYRIDRQTARATYLSTLTQGSDYESIDCNVAEETPVDLALTKTADQDKPLQGTTVTYTITLVNEGGRTATGVQVTDHLPDALYYVSSSAEQGAYNPASGIWNVGTVHAGQTLRLTLTAQVREHDPITNTAEVTRTYETDRDSTPGNNRPEEDDQDAVTITPRAHDINLCIQKWADNPAPHTGDEVTFTIRVCNDPDDFTDVVVVDQLPFGLTFRSLEVVDKGTATYDSYTHAVTWNIPSLPYGETATMKVTARLDAQYSVENCATITQSTPPENEADNTSCATVTPGQSSGGGDAGVESDGNLATKLAQRLFHRRQDAQARAALRAAPEPVLLDANATAAFLPAAGKHGAATAHDLSTLVPEQGPQGSSAFVVTPDDLLGITNATSVFAADYVRPEGRRLAALFGATSPAGILYDHAKTTCDRLGGGSLEDVRRLDVDGTPFVLSRLVHADGTTDYAVSFVAYDLGDRFVVDSRFAPDQYAVPAEAVEVLNLQVWSVAPAFTAELVRNVLSRLADQRTVTFLNTPEAAPAVPAVFVQDGAYADGRLTLRLKNTAGAEAVTLRGSVTRTEKEAEQQQRTAFEQTVALPPADADGVVTVEVPVGAAFDATFTVTHEASGSLDQVYYADGAWSYVQGDQSVVNTFETFIQDETAAEAGRLVVARDAEMTGRVKDWVSLFRYLRPNGRAVDLSAYDAIEFTASGTGKVHFSLEKASIATWDQYAHIFHLTGAPQTYRIAFDDLHLSGGQTGFTAEDVTLAAFYVVSDGYTPLPFHIAVHDVAFVNTATTVATEDAELPSAVTLAQNYPNPFNPRTTVDFSLAQAADVHLAVYDLLGREVALLAAGPMAAGHHSVTFEAGTLPSGTYLYRLVTPQRTLTQKMILMK